MTLYSVVIKAITVSVFVFLICGFVAYRTGTLEEWMNGPPKMIKTSETRDIISKRGIDRMAQNVLVPKMVSPKARIVSVSNFHVDEMMASSKSAILYKDIIEQQEIREPLVQEPVLDLAKTQLTLMSSSKSAIIFKGDGLAAASDRPFNKRNNIKVESPMLMSGSKSICIPENHPAFRDSVKSKPPVATGDTPNTMITSARPLPAPAEQKRLIIKKDSSIKKRMMMGSSKSGFIYQPENPDTVRKKQKK